MDKYIKVLLIQLSQKHDKVLITHIQSYNKEYNKITNIFKLIIKDKSDDWIDDIYEKYNTRTVDCRNKRELVQEMIKCVEERN